MLAVIGGTSLLGYQSSDLEKKIVHTPYGSSEIFRGDQFLLLFRHQQRRAPHRISYRSHISALLLEGADRIISIGSTGSLKQNIRPGSLLIPDDFIAFSQVHTIYNHSIGHAKPDISASLIREIAYAAPNARIGGCYIQTSGPRLETKAEIKWIANIGEVVGMTLGSEATLAEEMGIPFAAICTVDNYANGISKEDITYESIIAHARLYQHQTMDMLNQILKSGSNFDNV